VLRRLCAYAKEAFRQELSAACAAHARLGPASLVLYDVSTLCFETDAGDGFREPGFSKERRLEPQIRARLFRFLLAPMRGTVDAGTLFTWRGSVS
jgi:hypothetical protein